jgi:hypothetical protein
MLGQDSCERTLGTGQLGQESRDRMLGEDSQDMTAGDDRTGQDRIGKK